jgi:hypothetical protein
VDTKDILDNDGKEDPWRSRDRIRSLGESPEESKGNPMEKKPMGFNRDPWIELEEDGSARSSFY